jgi:signal peptidase I
VDGVPSPPADEHAYHLDPNISCGPDVHPFKEDARLLTCRDNFGPFRVPAGRLFMMGDNRENSNDSRFWGTVPMDYVKGRALFIYWSWDPGRFQPRWDRLFRPIH